MNKPVKIGVVGVGHLGQHHARILNEIEGANLVGISDVNEEAGKAAAEKYGVKYFKDFHDLAKEVEAVTVVVPTFLHHDVAKYFLQNNIHTFIEKPITKTLEDANDLVATAGEKQLTLQVGHVERFNAAMIKLQSLVENPRFIECQRLCAFSNRIQDVGVVLDLMIHDIDIVLSLVKSPVKSIVATGIPVLTNHEDIANAHILFENGCIANLTASRISEDKVRKLRVFELDKYMSLDHAEQTITLAHKSSEEQKIVCESLEIQKTEPLRKELEHFINCIQEKKKPLVTYKDGKNALEVALEILAQCNKFRANA